MTVPEVFIIESLEFEDEENNRYEGRIISDILHLNGKKSRYYYIRTKRELEKVVGIFHKSEYRYLHISCHGGPQEMATTLDRIALDKLGDILRPYVRERRLFLSACEMVNDDIARAIIPGSGCNSIIGPTQEVAFNDAAILWASFYHLMFSYGMNAMRRSELLKCCGHVARLFDVPLSYYSSSRRAESGFKLKEFGSHAGKRKP